MPFMVLFADAQRLWQEKGLTAGLVLLCPPVPAAVTSSCSCQCSEALGNCLQWETGNKARNSRQGNVSLWIKSLGKEHPRQSLVLALKMTHEQPLGFKRRGNFSLFFVILFNMKKFHHWNERYIASNYISSFYISSFPNGTYSRENSVKQLESMTHFVHN